MSVYMKVVERGVLLVEWTEAQLLEKTEIMSVAEMVLNKMAAQLVYEVAGEKVE